MQMPFNFEFETDDLRKPPYKESPASLWAYGKPAAVPRQTSDLPVGTQARFIEAAAIAADLGFPLNTLLTIRWDSLFSSNEPNELRAMPTPKRIDRLVELFRKWLDGCDLPVAYIWVREAVASEGEHWHLAFHLPKSRRPQFIEFVERQTREDALPKLRRSPARTDGEFACGEIGSWHLAGDTKPCRHGFYLAAYLGKAEPSEVQFRGKWIGNKKKPVRGCQFGGTEKGGKYDAQQGVIIGTACRRDRFFIAKFLQDAVKTKRGKRTPRPTQNQESASKKKQFDLPQVVPFARPA